MKHKKETKEATPAGESDQYVTFSDWLAQYNPAPICETEQPVDTKEKDELQKKYNQEREARYQEIFDAIAEFED